MKKIVVISIICLVLVELGFYYLPFYLDESGVYCIILPYKKDLGGLSDNFSEFMKVPKGGKIQVSYYWCGL